MYASVVLGRPRRPLAYIRGAPKVKLAYNGFCFFGLQASYVRTQARCKSEDPSFRGVFKNKAGGRRPCEGTRQKMCQSGPLQGRGPIHLGGIKRKPAAEGRCKGTRQKMCQSGPLQVRGPIPLGGIKKERRRPKAAVREPDRRCAKGARYKSEDPSL